jgi:hypothetical protein
MTKYSLVHSINLVDIVNVFRIENLECRANHAVSDNIWSMTHFTLIFQFVGFDKHCKRRLHVTLAGLLQMGLAESSQSDSVSP